jgi:hypothetical protein
MEHRAESLKTSRKDGGEDLNNGVIGDWWIRVCEVIIEHDRAAMTQAGSS